MCAHVYRRYATDIMHQAALAPARRLWFRIWIALGMPAVPMAMHGPCGSAMDCLLEIEPIATSAVLLCRLS